VGIIEKIASSLGLVTKAPSSQAAEAGFLPSIGAAAHSATGLVISQSTALTVSAVYACVTIRAQDGARCRPKLVDLDKSGPDSVVTDHPLARLLRRPNPQQTWFEFFEQMDIAYLLRGNAYAVIKRDAKGRPTALVPINPDGVTIYESAGGEIFYNVSRIGLWQMAMLAEFPPQIHSSDMLHLRGPSFSTLYGLSTIALGRDSIGLAMGLEQQSARFMANGARPSMVLESEKRVEHSLAIRLGQQFRDAFVGVKNTGGIPVLEDGLKAKPLQLTGVDIQFIEQRKMQVEDIARYWRMPMHKLGVGTAGSNRAQADQDYVSNTIMPDLHRWEEKLDQVFGLYDLGLAVDLDEGVLLRADVATRYANNRIALGGGAWATVNEIRASEGLAEAEENATGADAIMSPQNMAAIGSDKTGTAPDGAGHPFDAEGGVPGADNVPTDGAELPEKAVAAGEADITKRYNPDQPSRPDGKFGSGGSGAAQRGRKITARDFNGVDTVGWVWTGRDLADEWSDMIGAKPKAFAASITKGLGDVETAMIVAGSGSNIRTIMNVSDGKRSLATVNRLYHKGSDGEKVVTHSFFEVAGERRGSGIGKTVLRNSMAEYKAMGVSRVELHANIDAGSYVWAKFGFKPSESEWKSVRGKLKDRLDILLGDGRIDKKQYARISKHVESDDPSAIWKIANLRAKTKQGDGGGSTIGRALLTNQSWNGSLDLSDRNAMRKFRRYVGKS
jgi:HK97 family phage portal protein